MTVWNSTIKRRTPLKTKGGSRFPKMVDEDFRSFVRQEPCVIRRHHICWLPVAACHVIPKSRGVPDRSNLYPGCVLAHAEQEGKTKAFEEKYNLDLSRIACELWQRYCRAGLDFVQET